MRLFGKKTLFCVGICFIAFILGDKLHYIPTGQIRIVPVQRTVEGRAIKLKVVFPKQGAIESTRPSIQMNVFAYPLGSDSQFPRAKEIKNYPYGQSVHVVVDDRLYFPVTGPSIDVFDQDGNFRSETYEAKLPFTLEKGVHTVRAFLCRSYGESLKGRNCFEAKNFYVGKKDKDKAINLSAPYLTYNQPAGTFEEKVPVLLDFYLSNTELSEDGYKVKLSINNKLISHLIEWTPYYIYGLKKGKHTIQLQLLNSQDEVVSGTFNNVTKTIYIR